jgi:dienelactone hydrolase
MTSSLVRTEVRHDGLVGVLFHPEPASESAAVLPGVLTLGGSEGGLHERDAARLAEQGYAALALAYYGLPGLPNVLKDIPLEYFATALDHLRGHPRVDPHRIGIVGGSKGGEAALLVAATFPGIRAVVCLAGSGYVTQGISQSIYTGSFREIMTTPVACWTYQGREIPYLPNVLPPRVEAALDAGEPIALGWTKPDITANTDLVEAATIPVENIDGAVLLVVGADDIGGYGVTFHDVAARRLEAHKHPHAWQHIVLPGAGHDIIGPPDGTGPRPTTGPGPSGITFMNGGTPEINARARATTWRKTLDFLQQEL